MRHFFRLGSTQISLNQLETPQDFWARMESLVKQTTSSSCHALLLPEYCCLSLLVCGYAENVPFRERLVRFADHGYKEYEDRIHNLSHRYKLPIIGGTYPFRMCDGSIVNRCMIARQHLAPLFQDKLNMTRFEDETWGIASPKEKSFNIFELDGIRAAVAICYDVEFPWVTGLAANAGVELLLVPSCTDNVHGYWRVRHCAEARTIENQCFVAIASVVKGDPRFSEMDEHFGQAAILSPCDGSFPDKGLLAEGSLNQEGLCWADLDLRELHRIRKEGSVLNLRDHIISNSSP